MQLQTKVNDLKAEMTVRAGKGAVPKQATHVIQVVRALPSEIHVSSDNEACRPRRSLH